MLYVIPVPVGAVMVIVPVATVQVGCAVTEAVGAAGRLLTVTVALPVLSAVIEAQVPFVNVAMV